MIDFEIMYFAEHTIVLICFVC